MCGYTYVDMSFSWIEVWRSITLKDPGIISLTWMMGWEEVKRAQVAIVLGGSLPLRVIANVVDLIL